MTSVSPNSQRFERINELQLMLCYIKNKEMWGFNETFEPTGEIIPAFGEAELNAITETLLNELERLLNFEDLISDLLEEINNDPDNLD